MKKVFLFSFVFLLCSPVFAEAWFKDAIDPRDGMLDLDKLSSSKALEGAWVDRSYMEVKSIRKDSDNKVTVTMGDGRKQVYEKDVFHPEKGWERTY